MQIRFGVRDLIIGILVILLVGSLIFGVSVFFRAERLEKKVFRIEKENAELQRILNNAYELTDQMMFPEEAEEEVTKAIAVRDALWGEAISDTFLYRDKPISIVRQEIDTWNNTEISRLTGFKLRIED